MAKPKQTKKAAAWSLVVMGAGFAASLPFQGVPVGKLLVGSFEAGLVGGLADWFAVTALFRHPLGIPIPHTALLPKNRDKMTEGLVSAVENNLLNKDSITEKIADFKAAETVLDTLTRELHSDGIKIMIDTLCKRILAGLPLEQIAPLVAREIKSQAGAFDLGPILERAAHQMTERGYDAKALDYGLKQAEEWLVKPETIMFLGESGMKAISGIQMNGLMQFAMNAFLGYMNEERLGGILQGYLFDRVEDMKREGSALRYKVLDMVRTQTVRLAMSEAMQDGINSWKNNMLEGWNAEETVLNKLTDLRDKALAAMEDGQYVDTYALPAIERVLVDLRADDELMTGMNAKIVNGVTTLLEKNHSKIGKLVRENVDKMDNATLVSMIEDKVGQDLQWIRINGAVTGFVIGIALTALQMALA
ncbi:DUF445 domain-containing protein [Paenibacillus sp. FSL H7-0942]|uniref:DUF445 domain-containing protein n=1 Tax=Paenibacillus TaxID=44249 RepID=UPI00096DEC8F|nr:MULTISPECIES: DUF445 domain-containing protein [Paenibacillus]OMF00047.1 hypothetical protein BK129_27720 [Paenibacillus amylolyticus]OMF39921.1 hypothetical protein BK136_25320 [Paenibacillus amylolyticus]PKQ88114.1 DUF445 domain-containing protein [Paenibacillus sp. BGI2013]